MPRCYQMVGIPGSGKSTWIEAQDWARSCTIACTDRWVEQYAKEQGKTYSEVFKESMPIAVKLMASQVSTARSIDMDVIWDQTSTTVASRAKKFRMLPDYEHIAVVFKIPDPEELSKRLASRLGKTIPEDVLKDMMDNFEMPTVEEGFAEIWYN